MLNQHQKTSQHVFAHLNTHYGSCAGACTYRKGTFGRAFKRDALLTPTLTVNIKLPDLQLTTLSELVELRLFYTYFGIIILFGGINIPIRV